MSITRRTIGAALGGVSAVILVASLAACAGDAQTPYETPRPSTSETSFTLPPDACATEEPGDDTSATSSSGASSSGASSSGASSSGASGASTAVPDSDCPTGVPATADPGGNVDN